jgi:hypothetical protein
MIFPTATSHQPSQIKSPWGRNARAPEFPCGNGAGSIDGDCLTTLYGGGGRSLDFRAAFVPSYTARCIIRTIAARGIIKMFGKEIMKPTKSKLRLTLWLGSLLSAFFLGTAAVGLLREQQDVKVIQKKYNEIAINLRTKIEQVGEGVPRETFTNILPSAYFDTRDNEWVVSIPTSYNESPACTNTGMERKYFRNEGDRVVPVKDKVGVGGKHGDRFGPGGLWYYFWRAWYSSVRWEGVVVA